jgi:hypothetical protein
MKISRRSAFCPAPQPPPRHLRLVDTDTPLARPCVALCQAPGDDSNEGRRAVSIDPLAGNPSFRTRLWFVRCSTCVRSGVSHECDGGRDDAARAQVPVTSKLSAATTIKTTYHHGHRDG